MHQAPTAPKRSPYQQACPNNCYLLTSVKLTVEPNLPEAEAPAVALLPAALIAEPLSVAAEAPTVAAEALSVAAGSLGAAAAMKEPAAATP